MEDDVIGPNHQSDIACLCYAVLVAIPCLCLCLCLLTDHFDELRLVAQVLAGDRERRIRMQQLSIRVLLDFQISIETLTFEQGLHKLMIIRLEVGLFGEDIRGQSV